jgi:GTP-binding protein SAR1
MSWWLAPLGWFSWANYWLNVLFRGRCVRIVFLGLDNSGKTTLLHVLKDGRLHQHAPTQHPTSEELTLGKLRITACDLGGHATARSVWKNYYSTVDGIVFLVDAADPDRLPEARQELDAVLADGEVQDVPVVILGNKLDKLGAISEEQLCEALGISGSLTGKEVRVVDPNIRPLEVFMTSVVVRIGYTEAFQWLAKNV